MGGCRSAPGRRHDFLLGQLRRHRQPQWRGFARMAGLTGPDAPVMRLGEQIEARSIPKPAQMAFFAHDIAEWLD